ncbi:hypothetical protein THRCLA_22170 [Thraustotheca clavata]|uniref:Uncharacterized protein n=1 Tax=Thraustotheca clavata TaxID=74557 RepID=A0A1V9ZBA1_9STRA|nr:hypothetical protein THRCLA_22170 [Thraustotheca clavata]
MLSILREMILCEIHEPTLIFNQTQRLIWQWMLQNDLENVLKLLSNPKLIFAFPPNIFNQFKFQKYSNASGNQIETPSFKNVQRLEQYALEINLASDCKKKSKKKCKRVKTAT